MNYTTDVLIIGGGAAACRAALSAADAGAQVILASKRPPAQAGATSYPVAEMAGYNAGDPSCAGNVERHYQDIMTAGQGMADPEVAATLAAYAPQTIRQLEEWGVPFEKEEDGYYVFKSCFSSQPRTHVIRGHGEPIIRAMLHQIRLRSQITLFDDITIVKLLTDGSACCGAWGFCADGTEVTITAGAVVLATGGASQVFERNLNPADVSGDGYRMAFEIGAELVNMEFLQIGIGFSHPVVNIFNGYIWEGMPVLRNCYGQEFLSSGLPEGLSAENVMHEHRRHFPFSTSDCSRFLEIAIHREISEGRGSKNGGVIADLRHMRDAQVNALPDDCGIHHMWPIAREYMLRRGVDLLKQPVEICCFAHAVNGGVRINANASSTVPGLYAAGETAGGPHGADRLGGNMMVTCQVFGAIAGINAAQYAMLHARKLPDDLQAQIETEKSLLHKNVNAASVLEHLHHCTQRHLLVSRTENGLKTVLHTVGELQNELLSAPDTDDLHIENNALLSQLFTAKMMAAAALRRTESRGSHHRADYPEKDPMQEKAIVMDKNTRFI